MRLGFTGTQQGMSDRQKVRLVDVLHELRPTEFHHGDCIGADEEAHWIVRSHRIDVWLHPPIKEEKRAFLNSSSIWVGEPAEYLDRNGDIVDDSDVLVAMPLDDEEQTRSGTWATIRRARDVEIPIVIVFRNGSMKIELPWSSPLALMRGQG